MEKLVGVHAKTEFAAVVLEIIVLIRPVAGNLGLIRERGNEYEKTIKKYC